VLPLLGDVFDRWPAWCDYEGRLISMRRCTRSGTHCSKRLALQSHWWRRG